MFDLSTAMKKIMLLFVVFALMASSALAAMLPWPSYCEHQGYTFEYNEETRAEFCVFDDGEKCGANAFLDGTCGQEYIKEIPCRQKGETVFPQFEKCCAGLDPKSEGLSQLTCQELGFFEKLWRWFTGFKRIFI